jgi:hypothetical protein
MSISPTFDSRFTNLNKQSIREINGVTILTRTGSGDVSNVRGGGRRYSAACREENQSGRVAERWVRWSVTLITSSYRRERLVRTIGGVGILRRTMLEAVWRMHETGTMGFHSLISGVSMESIAESYCTERRYLYKNTP